MRFASSNFGTLIDPIRDARLTGVELERQVAVNAAKLQRLGGQRGRVVVIRHGGTPRFFVDLLSVWASGASAACLNPGTTLPELETIADFLNPVCILTKDDGGGSIRGVPVVDLASMPDAEAADVASELDDDALLLFTSGTTGDPKGVLHTFRSLLARTALNRFHIGDAEMARTLCVLPTHFGHGLIGNCLSPLMAGQDVILGPGGDLRFISGLGGVLDQYKITFMSSVPSFWKVALRSATRPKEGSLKRVHIGSAPLSADLWGEVAAWSGTRNVVNMYGITETANWIGGASSVDFEPEDGLIGRLWGGQAAVLLEGSHISATGEGELLVQTPSLMKGYYKRSDLSALSLRDGWFYTGDIGRIDADGVVRLTGRQKHEINRAGLKVHPEDIDILLERHKDVREACAFGIPDPISGEAVAVAVVLNDGVQLSQAELRLWAGERIAPEKVPTRWFFVTDIPKTDRGKINRKVVADKCLASSK